MDRLKRLGWVFVTIFTCSLWSMSSMAATYELPKSGNHIVGNFKEIYVEPGDTLSKIAQRYDVGYMELVKANPSVSPNHLRAWAKIIVPSAFVLPNVPYEGIVVNLAEMRLYYFPKDEGTVMTFPIAIGRQDWETPTGVTKVVRKKVDPEWNVPESIKEHAWETKGEELPDVMPAGPDNPLGEYALYLGISGYLIHGTNNPRSIGRRVSSGCMRMYPKDIEQLFHAVPVGTPVRIIHQPYKVGWHNGQIYLEAHPPMEEYKHDSDIRNHIRSASAGRPQLALDHAQTRVTLQQQKGYPVPIGNH